MDQIEGTYVLWFLFFVVVVNSSFRFIQVRQVLLVSFGELQDVVFCVL